MDVGPLIRAEHRDRVAHYVDQGVAEGATLLVDGRGHMQRKGFFLGPTILNDVNSAMSVGREEIFGPVLSVAHAQTLEEAIAQANHMALGNMAVIFTRDGRAAREFRDGVEAGMVGVNVPVAQPFAFFPSRAGRGRSMVTSMCMGPTGSSSIHGRRCSSPGGEDTGQRPHGGAGVPPLTMTPRSAVQGRVQPPAGRSSIRPVGGATHDPGAMPILLDGHHLYLRYAGFEGSHKAFHMALARLLSGGQRSGWGDHRGDHRDTRRCLGKMHHNDPAGSLA